MKEQPTPFDVLREKNLKRAGLLPDPERFRVPVTPDPAPVYEQLGVTGEEVVIFEQEEVWAKN